MAPGANGDLSPADVDSVADVIKEAEYLILQLEIPVESVLRAAKIAHENGVYVILNPAPACALPKELFRYVSLVIPNQTEISLLTGVEIKDEPSLDEAIVKIKEMGVKDVIVTLGSKGSIVASDGEKVFVPSQKVKAVDTTAAGDTFCGALCVALSEGLELDKAASFATKASALTVQRMGAQASIPFRREIE